MAIKVDKDKKRRDIAIACTELLLEKGIKNLTITEIAKTAGIGKGTVYDYFSNKEEIVFFVEEGTVEFSNNNLLILSSTIKSLDNFDSNSIDIIIKNSLEKMSNTQITDKEKYLLSHKLEVLKEISK